MSGALLRSAAIALAALLAQSCVVAPGGVAVEGVAPGYDADYYDAPAVYGGWGVGFDVAPYGRGDREHRPEFRGGDGRGGPDRGGGPVGFRPAAAGRSVPTIPTGARGGGGAPRGGGGGGASHGGGGGGGGHSGGRH